MGTLKGKTEIPFKKAAKAINQPCPFGQVTTVLETLIFMVVRTFNMRSTLLTDLWVYNAILLTTATELNSRFLEITHLA